MADIHNIKLDPAQAAIDAAGLVHVSQSTTLMDGKILDADDAQIWEVAGTGTGTWGANKYNMNVTSGQFLVRASKRLYPYFAGKVQRYEFTFDKFGAQANVAKRFGAFSSNAITPFASTLDGFYIENDGSTIKLYVTRAGTTTLNGLTHTSWSGYADLGEYQTIATWDYFTVVKCEYLWLGGAILVISIKTANGFIEAHRFNYSGTAQDIMMLSPNQQSRFEIRSTTGAGDFRPICCEVSTGGSIDESGEGIAAFATSALTCNAVGTIYALMGLKKQTTYRDVGIQITDIGLAYAGVTADAGIIMLLINPTVSAAITYANYGSFQVGTPTNQTITAGTGRVVTARPVGNTGGSAAVLAKNYLAWLSSTLANAHDEYVIAYMPVTANQSIYPVANLKEY